ncbi:MAG TPA: hypothetical protein VKU01_19615 [Bryobacteraceae bacterium]|nr:hypothetical protein [Bryobacteraceae bacterium]
MNGSRLALLLLLIPALPLGAQTTVYTPPSTQNYTPLTSHERFDAYLSGIVGVNAFVDSAAVAAIGQAGDWPYEWGEGSAGFGRRFASAYGQRFVGQTIMHGTAALLHEDNRFLPLNEGSVRHRLAYAVTSAFVARRDDGSRRVSFSAISGGAGAAFISRAWQPPSRSSVADGAMAFGLGFAGRIGLNVAGEFSPRMFKRFFQ